MEQCSVGYGTDDLYGPGEDTDQSVLCSVRTGLYAMLGTTALAVLVHLVARHVRWWRLQVARHSPRIQQGVNPLYSFRFLIPHQLLVVTSSLYAVWEPSSRWSDDLALLLMVDCAIGLGCVSHSTYLFDVLKVSLQAKCELLRQEHWSESDRGFQILVVASNLFLFLGWLAILLTLYLANEHGFQVDVPSKDLVSALWCLVTFVVWIWAVGFALYGRALVHSLENSVSLSSSSSSVLDLVPIVRRTILFFSLFLFALGSGGFFLAFIPWIQHRSCYFYCVMGASLTLVDNLRVHGRYKHP